MDCPQSSVCLEQNKMRNFSLHSFDSCLDPINSWEKYTAISTHYKGIAYAKVSRFLLWDKVSRSIRETINPERWQFEKNLLNWENEKRITLANINKPLRSFDQEPYLKRTWKQHEYINHFSVPYPSNIVLPIAKELALNENTEVKVIGSLIDKPGPLTRAFVPVKERKADSEFIDNLIYGIVEGLEYFKISLFEEDIITLKNQLEEMLSYALWLADWVVQAKPDLVLMHADNHPPYSLFCELAHLAQVPVVVMQHGLDCEPVILDHLYADHVFVWGRVRADRYRKFKDNAEGNIYITGSPQYDSLETKSKKPLNKEKWLLLTRPHTPDKCYFSTRWPDEGIFILHSVLDELEKHPEAELVIKPHPNDYADLYNRIIENREMAGRVTVTNKKVFDLFEECGLVISEDSTAFAESLAVGIQTILIHFSETPFLRNHQIIRLN